MVNLLIDENEEWDDVSFFSKIGFYLIESLFFNYKTMIKK